MIGNTPVADPGDYFWTKLRPEGPKKNLGGTGLPLISGSGWGGGRPPPPLFLDQIEAGLPLI